MRTIKTGSSTGYLTENAFIMERTADYKLAKLASQLFEVTPRTLDAGHGNLCGELVVNRQTKKARFVKDYCKAVQDDKNYGFYRALPSSLLMYRLACLFKGTMITHGQDGYKFTWQFDLKHKATGETICFGEWKGGSLFWTQHSLSTAPKEFTADIVKLINILVSDQCPHPYDGLVAGSVA